VDYAQLLQNLHSLFTASKLQEEKANLGAAEEHWKKLQMG
jgi:hypothetical protein